MYTVTCGLQTISDCDYCVLNVQSIKCQCATMKHRWLRLVTRFTTILEAGHLSESSQDLIEIWKMSQQRSTHVSFAQVSQGYQVIGISILEILFILLYRDGKQENSLKFEEKWARCDFKPLLYFTSLQWVIPFETAWISLKNITKLSWH